MTTQSDLNYLFSRGKYAQIRTEAENAWMEGVDADENPYRMHSNEYWEWNRTWRMCNKYC